VNAALPMPDKAAPRQWLVFDEMVLVGSTPSVKSTSLATPWAMAVLCGYDVPALGGTHKVSVHKGGGGRRTPRCHCVQEGGIVGVGDTPRSAGALLQAAMRVFTDHCVY
jgi:hypothetical protein